MRSRQESGESPQPTEEGSTLNRLSWGQRILILGYAVFAIGVADAIAEGHPTPLTFGTVAFLFAANLAYGIKEVGEINDRAAEYIVDLQRLDEVDEIFRTMYPADYSLLHPDPEEEENNPQE